VHTDTAPSPVTAPALSHRQILVVFSGIMLGMLLAAIDQTIVATALPTIVGDLGGLSHLSWVVTAYLLAETVSTPLFGKLGDLYGRKRLFQSAIVIFVLGSIMSGFATSMGQLIAFRAVQGIGAGGLIVLAMALIADVVSPRERGRYQGILALFVTSAVLPVAGKRRKVRIDWAGTTLLSGAIVSLVLLTTWGGSEYEWGSPPIIGLGVAAVVLAGAFVAVERRVDEPAIPLRLFRIRTFNIAAGVSFVIGVGLFGAVTYLPTFLQVANGASASNSGLLLVPMMGGLLVASITAGQIITRTGRYRRFPIAGMALASLAMYLLSTLGTDSSRWESGAYMVLLGAGIGMVMQIMVLATQNEAPVADLGVATSTVTFFRAVGGSVGVALAGALFNSRLTELLGGAAPSGMTPEELGELAPEQQGQMAAAFADAITTVFRYAVPLLLLGFLITWWLKEKPLRSAAAPSPTRDGADADRELAAPAIAAVAPANGNSADTAVADGHADLVDWGEPSVATGG
jgi:MFS family permease